MDVKNVKSVSFDDVIQKYYYINEYSREDYKYWIQARVDRERFHRRINNLHILIKPCLLKKLNEINN
jgi:hypothetical protein